jgi:predicted ATPase
VIKEHELADPKKPAHDGLARRGPVRRVATSFEAASLGLRDLQEQRRRGFAALRGLLTWLSKRQPIILFIDDLQWGDSDSANLVAELLRPPDAPPLLLIGCYRTEDAGASPFLETFSSFQAGIGEASFSQLVLSELAPNEAAELASGLVGATAAEGIVRHAGGNPFFIGELARFAESQIRVPQNPAGEPPSLGDLVRARVSMLPEPARCFLELVAVAGQPIDSGIVRLASQTSGDERAILAVLRAGRLIRTRITNKGQEIEPYHDRIRETVSGCLPAGMTRDLHLRLARALARLSGI